VSGLIVLEGGTTVGVAIYFTADLHLHHENIIRYVHRNPPFANAAEMDRGLIRNWNRVIKRHDTVYHLGDFCLAGRSTASDAVRVYRDAMRMIRGKTVLLKGNHDSGLRYSHYCICRRLAGMKIFMRHWPPWEHPRRFPHSFSIPVDVDLILCGHVHDKWKYREYNVGQRCIPVVNVGTDVWGYKPVSLRTIRQQVLRDV